MASPGSESTGDVEKIALDDNGDVTTVAEFGVALWTGRSEDDDERLKDRQACASRLTALR